MISPGGTRIVVASRAHLGQLPQKYCSPKSMGLSTSLG